MTAEEIAKLAAAGESETLEFKSTTGTLGKAIATVCAMLNHRGGHVLFGVTPSGEVVGQQVGEQTMEKVAAELRRIDPPALPEIKRIPVTKSSEVIVIHVDRGTSQPYRYQGISYRRVGNTNQKMSSEECNHMLFERMHDKQRWENQPADGWSVGDLDTNEIRTTVEEAIRRGRLEDPGTRDLTDLLRGLGLFKGGVLLQAAVALFGKEEQLLSGMPQCLLRVAHFKGIDRTEFLDNRQFHGNAFTLLRVAERFLISSLPIAGRILDDRFERIDEPLFPPIAMREALVNAFCHRDYSAGGGSVGVAIYDDRLEITSPGTLHFELTPEKLFLPHDSRPWNPLIAEVFYRRGIIERWGRGTLKMAELATAANLPPPEIEDDGLCVTVRFRSVATSEIKPSKSTIPVGLPTNLSLNKPQQAVFQLLSSANRPLALRDIQAQLPEFISVRQTKRALTRLKELELVQTTGRGGSARWSYVQK